MNRIEKLLDEVELKINLPMVTAKFGDNWKENQKKLLEEGQINVDMIINMAWRQGRKALLLEQLLHRLNTIAEEDKKAAIIAVLEKVERIEKIEREHNS